MGRNKNKRGTGVAGQPATPLGQTARTQPDNSPPDDPAPEGGGTAVPIGHSPPNAFPRVAPMPATDPAFAPAPPRKSENWDWHKHIPTWVAIATLLVTSIFNYKSSQDLQTQIRMQRESLEQSQPVDFRVESLTLPKGETRVVIRNLGRAEIVGIRANMRYYFAFPDGQVRSQLGIQKLLREDHALLAACRAENLLVQPGDVAPLLGAARDFSVVSLNPGELFEPELSQSSILNAVRLAHILKVKALTRWLFEYQHRVSHQRFITELYLYFLIRPTAAAQTREVRAEEVLDLTRTVGGKALIEAIVQIEERSREIIFPSP